ncbi:uncharacterized protein M421DRAFT_320763 [Didymella exigua CBS 183.55]|uniref:Secreted protein n=1 Tax=Didymella exigua CBS 183.55 TaxID=1150837 RepID=A0A6A5RW53_9PLEO|nr:uncharacterized protein M421DRAFT_320763 [Didymella exigua CBS 183.55]KAF1931793.1 hypothetical protein M421DRAFT_320763 [Didymella exigua CBS 183.55]
MTSQMHAILITEWLAYMGLTAFASPPLSGWFNCCMSKGLRNPRVTSWRSLKAHRYGRARLRQQVLTALQHICMQISFCGSAYSDHGLCKPFGPHATMLARVLAVTYDCYVTVQVDISHVVPHARQPFRCPFGHAMHTNNGSGTMIARHSIACHSCLGQWSSSHLTSPRFFLSAISIHLVVSLVSDVLASAARSILGIWYISTTVNSPLHQDHTAGHRRFYLPSCRRCIQSTCRPLFTSSSFWASLLAANCSSYTPVPLLDWFCS